MLNNVATTLLLISVSTAVWAGEPRYTVDSADGGDARMDLGFFTEVNASAKLRRISWAINNSESPVELIKAAGLKPEYKAEGELYTYIGKGEAKARQHVQALEVTFLVFSVFNQFVDATFGVEIIDFQPGMTFDLKRLGKFPTNWAEVHYFYQTVTFVSKAKMNTGELWQQDYGPIKAELAKLGLEPPDDLSQSGAIREY